MKIVLAGFMGSGKTTLMREFSKHTSLKCVDLDEYIAKCLKIKSLDLGKWIEKYGFNAFRQKESESLTTLLSEDVFISLGGGTLSKTNIESLSKLNVKTIWLETDFSKCLERVNSDQNRPLAKKTTSVLEEIYFERKKNYQSCDESVDGDLSLEDQVLALKAVVNSL